jgi:hypothetical protein
MVMSLYSVYDRVAKEFGPLFEAKSHDAAVRKFRRLLSTKPDDEKDCELHYFLDFDRERGCFGTERCPAMIAFSQMIAPLEEKMTVSEAMTRICEKLGDRVSVAGAEELERQLSEIAKKYGGNSGEIGERVKMLFEVFGV